MAFTHRMVTLAAVVAIPLGIAATSYALTDSPEPPKAPPKVELESRSPSATPGSPRPTPSDEKVSPPPVSENSTVDENTDDTDDAADDDADDQGNDDGPGDDG